MPHCNSHLPLTGVIHQRPSIMYRHDSNKAPVTYQDVSAYFSEEEWKLLHDWQKELYSKVMNEVHQCLTSLGPLIASTVYSLTTKERKGAYSEDHPDSDTRRSIDGDVVASSVVSFWINPDGTQSLKENSYTDLRDHNHRTFNADMDLRTDREFRSNGLMEHHSMEAGESGGSFSSGQADLAPVVTFQIKEEVETSFMGNQDSDRTEIRNSLKDDGTVTMQQSCGESVKCHEWTLPGKASSGKNGVLPISEKQIQSAPITFRDVTAYFSEDEWKLLHEWQKEVYNNVMKDIQQIVVSLGPLIASSVFSLRANNKEDLCCMEHDNSERRHTVEHTPSGLMVNSDDVLTKNHEENQYLIAPQDTYLAENDDCIRSGFGPFISTIVLRQEHKDSLEDYPGADGEDSRTDDKIEDVGITQIVSYRVKEEGGGYSSSGQGSKKKSNTNIPTGIGSVQKYDRIEETDTNMFYSTDTLPRETNEEAYQHSWTKEYDKTSSYSQRRRRTPRENRRTQCTGNEIAARTSQKTSDKQQAKTTAARRYRCSECGKRFTTNSSRTIHLRTHTGEKPYKCNVCGKCFRESSKLIRHCRIHTGFKPYKCNECGKCFNQSSNLVSHKNTHTGVKPYTCGQCGKSFAQNSTLTAHVRRHKGGKSYSCRECRQSFNQLSSLLSHNQTHVKNKP